MNRRQRMKSSGIHRWWIRPAGGREVLRIALPLLASSISWTLFTFVDRVFLTWVSASTMAAVFLAGTVWFAVMSLPLGICNYVTTFVSQYHGKKQYKSIGPFVWQGVWAATVLSIPAALVLQFGVPVVFSITIEDETTRQLAATYLQILTFGVPGMLLGQSLNGFAGGCGKTRIIMYVDASCAMANIVLDYVLIFGHCGFPRHGIEGAAWASVIALWLKAGMHLCYFLRRSNRKRFATWSNIIPDRESLCHLHFYGGGSGTQMLLDVLGFTVFVLSLSQLGATTSAATGIAFSVSSFAFMPLWGLSTAVSILVGQKLGEGNSLLAERATWTAASFALAYGFTIALAYVLLPEFFLRGFFGDMLGAGDDHDVHAVTRTLLRFVALYTVFDAAQMVFVGALKGAGDTVFVMITSISMSIVLAGSTWVGVKKYNFDTYHCWLLFSVWILSICTVYTLRFICGRWKSISII